MTAVFTIPDAWIEKNVHAALAVLKEEGEYPHYFFDYPYGQADNNTDMMMYRNLITEDGISAVKRRWCQAIPGIGMGMPCFCGRYP